MIEHTDSLDVPRTVEGPSLSAERQEYLLKVQKIVDLLESSELKGKWWMIGGIAKDAYTGNIDFRIGKPDHPRDVDILVKEGDIRAFERVRAQNTTNIPIGGFVKNPRPYGRGFRRLQTSFAPHLFFPGLQCIWR